MAKRKTVVEKATASPFVELGATGLQRWGGVIEEEFVRELKGDKARRLFREMMDNSPVIGAFLYAIKQILRRVPINVVEGDDQRATELLQTCLDDMSLTWEDTLSEILSMLPFGWSLTELVYKRRAGESRDPSKNSRYTDGRIGWRKLAIRSQESIESWVFDDAGGIQAFRQMPAPSYKTIEIPVEKFLLFRTEASRGSPEGRSILRAAYTSYYYAKKIQTIEAIGIARDLAGMPVAYVPPEVINGVSGSNEAATFTAIKKLVTRIHRDEQEGIVFPMLYDANGNKLYELQLLSTGGSRQFDTTKIVERYDQRIAMSVLADFLLLGHGATGSRSLGLDKSEIFEWALAGFLDSILAVFNRHAIPRLLRLNGLGSQNPPQLDHGRVGRVDLKELGDYLTALSGAGAPLFPDPELEEAVRQVANLPVSEETASEVGKRWARDAEIDAMVAESALRKAA